MLLWPDPGTKLPHIVIEAIALDTVRAFADIQRDPNPIHVSDTAAKAAGFDAPIVHGAFIYAQLERLVRQWGRGSLVSLNCRFVRPLLVGQALYLTGRVAAIRGEEAVLRLTATAADATPLAIAEARLSFR